MLVATDNKGKRLGNLPPISCASNAGDENLNRVASCAPYFLPDGGFFVVDCFTHDSVATDCYVRLYSRNGVIDDQFKSDFPQTYEQALDIPKFRTKNRLKRIQGL